MGHPPVSPRCCRLGDPDLRSSQCDLATGSHAVKRKLRFKLTGLFIRQMDHMTIEWREWTHTPEARQEFFSHATTMALIVVKARVKKLREHQHMARMRAAKAAKREA